MGQLAFTTAIAPTPASAAPGQGSSFDCFGGTVYVAQRASSNPTVAARIVALATSPYASPVVSTPISSFPNGAVPNALGISRGGSAAWAVNSSGANAGVSVYEYDALGQTWTTHTGTSANDDNYVAGAVDPFTGIYYYGTYVDGVAKVFGFNTVTKQAIAGTIATFPLPITTGGQNGDFSFDLLGNLYAVESVTTAASGQTPVNTETRVVRVNGPLPTTGSANPPALAASTLSSFSQSNNQTTNGMTFDNYGKLYLENTSGSTTSMQGVNPNTGEITNANTQLGFGAGLGVDLASCGYNPTLSGQVNLPARANPTDQFTVTITGGGVSGGNTATTTGTATGLQTAKAGPTIGVTGTTYTVTQTAAGTTNPASYSTTYSCVDSAAANRSIASGTGSTVTLPFPAPATNFTGANVECTFTNTPSPASLATTLAILTVNGAAATSSTQVKAGDVVVYRSTTTNSGALAGTTVITQTAPANSTYTGTGQGWAATGASHTQTVTVPAGGSTSTDYTVTLQSPLPAGKTTVVDTITSSVGTCATCSVSNPTAGVLDTVNTIALVNGEAATSATQLKAGDQVFYQVFVANTGGSSATTVVTATVPANTSYTGTGQGWVCVPNNAAGATCTRSITAAANSTSSVYFPVTVAAPLPAGTTTIASTVSSSVGSTSVPTVTNATAGTLNTVKSIVSVNGVAATATTQLKAGDVVVYRDAVTNTGGSTASTVLTETVPANTSFSGIPAQGWSCAAGAAAGTTCTRPVTVSPGATVGYFFQVTVASPLPSGTSEVVSTVSSSVGTTTVPTATNATVAVLDTVKTIVSVNGVAADATTQLKTGDVVVYNDRVTNTGGSTGTTTLTNIVPANTAYTGAAAEGWTAAGGTRTKSVSVAPGTPVDSTYTVTVGTLPAGTTSITSTVASSNGTTSVASRSNPTVAVLDTVKTVVSVNGAAATSATPIAQGDVVVYRDTTTNTGGSAGTTTLSNIVPANSTYTGAGWTAAGANRTQAVTVPASSSVAVDYQVTYGALNGAATVTGTVDSSNGSESVPSVVNPTAAVLTTVKTISTVNGAPATATTQLKGGDTVVYLDTVTNTGGVAGTTVLSNIVPANTSYNSGAVWTASGANYTKSVAVGAGASVATPYTVVVGTLPADTTTITSTVSASAGTVTVPTVSNPTVAQLDTVKTILTVNGAAATASTPLKQGDVVVYADTTTNRGGAAGTTVLTEIVPANTTATNTAAQGWAVSGANYSQSVTVTPGTPVTTLYTVTVGELPTGTTSITSTVASSTGGASVPSVSNPSAGRLDTVTSILTVNGAPATATTQLKAGDVVVYRDTVTNTGGASATTVLTEIVPANSTFTGTGWTASGADYTRSVTVAAGASESVDYAVTLADPLPANTQTITSTVASSVGTVSVPSAVNPTVAVLTSTTVVSSVNGEPADATTPIAPGDVVVYTTTVVNTGGSLGATTLGDTVPANANYTGTGEGWSCAPGNAADAECTQTVLVAAGNSSTKTFTVTVDSPLPAGTTAISNTTTTSNGAGGGTIASPTVGSLDTVKTILTVNGAPATADTELKAGDVVVYRDRTVNTGGSTIGTVLTNTLPANTAYTGTSEGWSASGTQPVSVAAGATVDKFYTVTVANPLASGVASVTSSVSSSNGAVSVPSVTNPTAGVLDIVKTIVSVNGSPATAATQLEAGDVVVYRDTVTNTGGSAASTTLTEGLPANTAYTGTGEGWTAAGDTRTQTVSAPANSSVAVTYTVTVASPLPAGTTSIVSTVSASAGTVSTPTASNATVGSLDLVSTIVSVNGEPATADTQLTAGDVVVYRATVTNTGGSPATTTVRNTLPANAGYTGVDEGWTADGDDYEQAVTVGSGASTAVEYTVTIDRPLPAGVETITLAVSSSTGTVATPTVVNATVGVLDVVKTIVSVNGEPATADTLVAAGDVVVYRDTVTNTGGSPASTTLTETLPANTSYTGTDEGWAAGVQTVTVGAGESESVEYTVTVASPLTAGVQSIISTVATSAGTASVPTVTSTTVAVIATTLEVVSVNGEPADATTPIGPGDVVVYGYTVTNTGGSTGSTTLGNAVPANTTYTGTDEGWSCATAATAATACEQAVTVAAAGGATVLYTVTVVAALPTGTQTISNSGTSSTGAFTGATVSNPTVANLDTVKTIVSVNGAPATSATQIGAGDVVVYRDTNTNTGGSAASTVLTETLPANSAYTGTGQGWTAADGGSRTQTVDVAANSAESVDYTVTIVDPLPSGVQTIVSTVASSAGAVSVPTVTNATAGTLSTTVAISTINGEPYTGVETVKAGDVVVYTITTVNGGGSPATTTLDDTVPANTAYTGAGEGWTGTGAVRSQEITVAANSTSTTTFTVTVDSPLPAGTTTIDNSVSSSASPCPDCAVSVPTAGVLSTAIAITTVNGSDATAATSVRGGDRLGYTLRLRNVGGTPVTTTLTTTIPANTVYSGAAEGWVCPDGVEAGAVCTIEVTVAADTEVSVPFSLRAVGPFASTASEIAVGVESSVGECVDCAVANPLKVANLAVTVTSDRPTAPVGERVSLTVTVTNLGPDDATAVELQDVLTRLGFVSASTLTGSYDEATRTWRIGTLANGATAQLTIVATVLASGWTADVVVSNGGEVDSVLVNNVSDTASLPAWLAFTGAETAGVVGLSGALLLAGLVLILARRRREGGRHVLGA